MVAFQTSNSWGLITTSWDPSESKAMIGSKLYHWCVIGYAGCSGPPIGWKLSEMAHDFCGLLLFSFNSKFSSWICLEISDGSGRSLDFITTDSLHTLFKACFISDLLIESLFYVHLEGINFFVVNAVDKIADLAPQVIWTSSVDISVNAYSNNTLHPKNNDLMGAVTLRLQSTWYYTTVTILSVFTGSNYIKKNSSLLCRNNLKTISRVSLINVSQLRQLHKRDLCPSEHSILEKRCFFSLI